MSTDFTYSDFDVSLGDFLIGLGEFAADTCDFGMALTDIAVVGLVAVIKGSWNKFKINKNLKSYTFNFFNEL